MGQKYSVILCTLASGGGDFWKNPQEILETVAASGYDGVDLDAEPDRIEPDRFKQVTDLVFSLGLKIPALIGAWAPWHAGEVRDLAATDEAVRKHAVNYAKRSVDLAATFQDPPVFEIVASPAESEYPETKVPRALLRKNFVKSAREIARYAAERNVQIAIEPINRFEGYAGFLNSLSSAKVIADEVDAENLGVLADLFHVNMEDSSLPDALQAVGSKLMHVHLADSNRQTPGTGHIDFLELMRTLESMNFGGYLSLDCVPAKPEWKTLVTRSIGFMKQVEEMVALQKKLATEN